MALFAMTSTFFAQDRTTVNAMSSEISDNLDLKAVASIFGDSQNLEDFERKLNDRSLQISNLDLNNDNQVDYLRIVESVQGNAHIIVLQDIIGRDQYQDVATIEVQRDYNNQVQVQVVGDTYLYGNNYIYQPNYYTTPLICDLFWRPNYRPYYSAWNWNYYPSYYYAWQPYSIFGYRNHIGLCINYDYEYNFVNYRLCQTAYNNYYCRRNNFYERQYPNYAFGYRHENVGNRYELNHSYPRYNSVGYSNPRGYAYNNPRNYTSPRGNNYQNNMPRNENPRTNVGYQNHNTTFYNTPRPNVSQNSVPRGNIVNIPHASEPRQMGGHNGGYDGGVRGNGGGNRSFGGNSGNHGGGGRR